MEEKRKEFGKHYLVEFIGCEPERLKKKDDIQAEFLEAARLSGATILGSHFHQFDPHGVSAMIFIAESHFSIHTWPEDGYVAFDVLTCGQMESQKAIDHLTEYFQATRTDIRVLSRGIGVE